VDDEEPEIQKIYYNDSNYREALKTARAHGDFRENSEFDAAKERRNHLGKRRHELETELAMIQPISMANVVVEDTAVIGSQVVLEFADKSRETYYLLGSADGNAEKNYVSYLAGLGKAIFNHSKGETLTVPGNKKATIVEVNALPAELIAELDA
jgi:transcription elongation GreA/GreB family factor